MIIPLFARDTNNNNATTASLPTTDNTNTHAHTSLAHRNLVGVLVIAALLVLALALSLCFAKWSKPIRRFLRGERSGAPARFGIGDDLLTPTKAPLPPSPRPPQGNATDAEKAVAIPNSSSSQCSLDQDVIEIDEVKEKANAEVALPAKVLHAFTIKSGGQLARLGR